LLRVWLPILPPHLQLARPYLRAIEDAATITRPGATRVPFRATNATTTTTTTPRRPHGPVLAWPPRHPATRRPLWLLWQRRFLHRRRAVVEGRGGESWVEEVYASDYDGGEE